jgi:hypothetical protein
VRGVSFELTGVRGLEAALEKMSAAARAQVGRLNRDTAFAIQTRARANAPRDRGDLIAAIAVQGKDLNWRVGVLDVRLPTRGGDNSAHLNPYVYGVWYEYGFVTRRIERHPFMGPAVASEEQRHLERVAQAARNIESSTRAA